MPATTLDSAHHRLLEYTAPFSTDEAASLVLAGAVAKSSTILNAFAIAFDQSGNVWFSDGINGIAEFTTPFSAGEAVTQVIGPKALTSASSSTSSTAGSGLKAPEGLAFDSAGNLWVADFGHGRVLEYGNSAASTLSTSAASSLSSASSSTASGSSGGVPVFPYQALTATIFTIILVTSYLVVRQRGRTMNPPR